MIEIEEQEKNKIAASFENAGITVPKKGRLVVAVPRESLCSLLLFLKMDDFEHLSLISCVDWLGQGELELVYHLWSYQKKIHAIIKTRIDRESPHFLSIIALFRHAQTYEREIHEMFGVRFEGNPRQIPFLLDHWQGAPPMRKDFDLRKYVKEKFGVEERAE